MKGCSETTLLVHLSNASSQVLWPLKYVYPSFTQFMGHFSNAPRPFRFADFVMENAALLAPYRIRTVTLIYRVPQEIHQVVLKDVDAYKRYEENNQVRLRPPDKICCNAPIER